MKENVVERLHRLNWEQKIADFNVKMQQDYSFKRKYAAIRAREFAAECDRRGLNYHVSVGGLDSIVLFLFLRSLGIDAPGVSASHLEDVSIQRVHKALGIECVKPLRKADGTRWTQTEILRSFGFPVLSKEIATKIEVLQNPTVKNKTVRHAIITGETGEYGGYRTGTRMKLPKKWLEKFGGYENETEGTNYQRPNFRVSEKCCYYLKERPCDIWAKEHNSVPYLGLMASEGGRRAKSLKINGCNYFGASTIRSAPFAIFQREDVLQLALEMDQWYHDHWRMFPAAEPLDTIVPAIYGEIAQKQDGTLYTTKAQRTGCLICGFGVHLDKRPHKFDLIYKDNPVQWEKLMFHLVQDDDGTEYGWARVLGYIGVEWDGPDAYTRSLFEEVQS